MRPLSAVAVAVSFTLFNTVAFAAPPAAPAPAPAAAPSPAAAPGSTDEARTHYTRGVELYNDGDYKLALIEFQRSYDLSPTWRLLYNIGEVHFQLNSYSAALKSLENYLAQGGKEITDKRRAEVEKDIEALKSRTAFLSITSNVEGGEVTLDELVVGKTPLPPGLLVDAGTRRISISKQGYKTAVKSITVAPKDRQSLAVDLTPEAAPVEASSANLVWIGWVATGLVAVGAVTTGVLAINANSDLKNLQNQRGVTRSQLDDKQSQRNTFALAADILTGAAIVGAGVSLYFTIKGPSKSSTRKDGSLGTRIGPGSVSLVGTF